MLVMIYIERKAERQWKRKGERTKQQSKNPKLIKMYYNIMQI